MTDPTPTRIIISPHPLPGGFVITSYSERTSVITAETLERARAYAQQLAATAGSGYSIIEETRLMWPLYVAVRGATPAP